MARAWNLRMNLGDLNLLAVRAVSDESRAMVFNALVLGCNGGDRPECPSKLVQDAFDIGAGWRSEAEGFMEKKAQAGRASAESRKASKGSADPRFVNTVQNTVQNTVGTQQEQCVNQYTINNQQSTNNKKTRKRKPASAKAPADFIQDLQAIIDNWPRKTVYRNNATGAWEPARVTMMHTPDHLWERMVKFCPGEDPTLLVNCAISYLNGLMVRPKVNDVFPNVCAMTNFFGEKAIWKRFVGDAQEA